MSTFVSAQNLMMGLLGNKYGEDAVAQAVVAGAYRTFKVVDATNASKTLTTPANLVSMYSTTYQALTGATAVATGRRLLQSTMTPAQLQNIFGAVADVLSSTNQQVQQVVNTATEAAADPSSTVDTANLMVTVSKMATVQQQSLASDISALATTFAASPTTDELPSLQDSYSGTALEARLAAVNIDEAAVESAMDSLNQSALVPAESPKSLAWVAGPVIGASAFIAACGALYWWFTKHRAAQATNTKDKYMDTMAEARSEGLDGGTPREGSARAQAALN
ncbi:hypothetical protein COO60DRAFT_711735 [Scenedesmus sp. NREL 46B-D3]|nr:hypothetical protein COO60DRAFT_711735 [Scenedesmus sp. NREL 46B-D3]